MSSFRYVQDEADLFSRSLNDEIGGLFFQRSQVSCERSPGHCLELGKRKGVKFKGIYRRGKTWWITYFVGGRQRFESSRSTRKLDARDLLDIRKGAAREGRLRLTKSKARHFDEYAEHFLLTVQHPNTQKRYRSSVRNLEACFKKVKLSDITPDVIEDFKEKRLLQGVRTATVNRDLAVLHSDDEIGGTQDAD